MSFFLYSHICNSGVSEPVREPGGEHVGEPGGKPVGEPGGQPSGEPGAEPKPKSPQRMNFPGN